MATHVVSPPGVGLRAAIKLHMALWIIRTTTHARARSSASPAAPTTAWNRRRTPSRMLPVSSPQRFHEHRRDLVVGVAADRFGIDHQPRLAFGRVHVPVVEVAVDDAAGAGRVENEVAAEGYRLLHQAARDGGAARKAAEVGGPALDVRGERAQLRQGRDVDPPVEPGDDLARFDVRQRVEVLRMQPLQQHGPAAWIGA